MNIARRTVRGLVGRLLDRAEARAQHSQIHALDDRMLRDIGLVRGQIEDAFHGRLDATARR